MRCDEARRKLTELESAGANSARDQKLQDHLKECPACARLAQVAETLREDLAHARVDDNADSVPFAVLQSRVEQQATLAGRSHAQKKGKEEKRYMSALVRPFKQKPRLSIPIAAALVILLAATLIPFKYDKAVGYEVAFAGVNKELAEDQFKLQELLTRIGVENASIDVSDCDHTCTVTISELQSQMEARYILEVLEGAGDDVRIVHEATPIHESQEGSFIYVIHEKYIGDEFVDDEHKVQFYQQHVDVDIAHEIMIELLGFGGDVDEHRSFEVVDTDRDVVTIHTAVLGTPRVDLSKDQATPEVLEYLHEMGCQITVVDSEGNVIKELSDESLEEIHEDEVAAKTGTDSELPDGYALSQNYPNPFNPTTRVDYSIPSSQHVRMDIYNINGQLVKTLVDGVVSAGQHTVEWDATTDTGSKVASGVYLYRLSAGEVTQTKKMIFTK